MLKLKENQIFSYVYKFKGKLARKASGIIIGLLLNENDKPEKFRSALKEGAEAIEVLGLSFLKMNSEEFNNTHKKFDDIEKRGSFYDMALNRLCCVSGI